MRCSAAVSKTGELADRIPRTHEHRQNVMKAPLVSVIIPSYNSAHFLNRSVDSVLAQTHKNIEIIIIDDGSTDDTAEVIKRFADKVRYHYQENRGLAGARNAGIELARGQYIQFLDADDWIAAEKLERQVTQFEKSPEISVVYSDYVMVDDSGSRMEENTRWLKGKDYGADSNVFERLLCECFLVVHSTLVRAEVFQQEGKFDEDRNLSEDWDLWLRLACRGHKFHYVPGEFAYYYKHGEAMTENTRLLHDRRRLLFEKFVGDSGFDSLNDKAKLEFRRYQHRALADDLYHFKDWRVSRAHLTEVIRLSRGLDKIEPLTLLLKTFVHEYLDAYISKWHRKERHS